MQETNDGFCKHSSCSNGIINHTRTSILNHISCVALQCHDEQQMASQINDTKHAWQRGKELNTMSVVAKFKKKSSVSYFTDLWCDLTGACYLVTWPAPPAILWLDRRPLSCDLTGAKGAGSYLAGMAVAIPILNVDGRRHTNNFSKNIKNVKNINFKV